MATSITTGLVRLSYAQLWTPKAMADGQDAKYSVSLIIPKKDKATIKLIEDAIKEAIEKGHAEKWGGKPVEKQKNFKYPLHDGDEEREGDAAYANSYFITARSSTQPKIVDRNIQAILDQDEVYSGCYGRASINFYPFNTSGSVGVGVGLNAIQKIKDGERLGGGVSADDAFGGDNAYDDEDDDF